MRGDGADTENGRAEGPEYAAGDNSGRSMTSTSLQAFADSSRRLRSRIERALDRYTTLDADCPEPLREAMRHSLLDSGKRLRPVLVLMAARACGGDVSRALPAACAVEMVHTYSLIHDDLPAMDDDDMRRGRPSCHAQFGEALAILAGDALLTLAFEVLARHTRPRDVAAALLRGLGPGRRPFGVGGRTGRRRRQQRLDGRSGPVGVHPSPQDRRPVHVALRLGGLVAARPPKQPAALGSSATNLGLAFQIIDDVLDLRGDESSLGNGSGRMPNRVS